jgi:hypothetical protein
VPLTRKSFTFVSDANNFASDRWLKINWTKVQNLEPLEDLTALRQLVVPDTVPESERLRFKRYRREKKLQPVEML